MKTFEHLKLLYRPVQPTIKQTESNVIYQEVLPDAKLQHLVYCYWQLKTNHFLNSPFNYRVVADGCIDIFFDLHNSADSAVMGFCKKYTMFPLGNQFNYIGIRFFPSMFPQIFKINARDLSNNYHPLNQVVPAMATFLQSQFTPDLSFLIVQKKLNDFLITTVAKVEFDFDDRFYNALNLILKSFGILETETQLNTGISPRQLRRIFNYYIGTTPKTFSKVVRFQHILNAKPSTQSLKQSKIFYDVGFFDQAHFIKDFKNFYGVTPTQAFR